MQTSLPVAANDRCWHRHSPAIPHLRLATENDGYADESEDSSALDESNDDEIVPNEDTADSSAAEATKHHDETSTQTPVENAVNGAQDSVQGVTKVTLSKEEILENLLFVQSVGTITSRGEYASDKQKDALATVIDTLEAANPNPEPTITTELMEGTWELVVCSHGHLFRSSPFFMAARAVCTTPEQAQQFDWFCTMHRKALAISNIGAVRQIVSRDRLVSEFEVKAGAVPFLNDLTPFSYSGGLPVTIDGAIVSSADLTAINTTTWELYMDTVEIKGSNLPGVRQALDAGLKLQSRQLGGFLMDNLPGYTNPRPLFRTTFLNEQFRISRDMDDNYYVYVKTSSETEPSDYSKIDADLGVARLLEGFNDAVTRFYI
jgi:hypothetical protein